MAICVIPLPPTIPGGPLTLGTTFQSLSTCNGYVLTTVQEYASLPTLLNIFTVPVSSDMREMWMIGFSLPIICWLTAWAYGSVINFMEQRKH